MSPRPPLLCLFLAAAAAPALRASPETDLYAMWQRLHAERGCAWKTLDRESWATTPRDFAHAEVHGRLLTNGDAVLEVYTSPLASVVAIRRGGRALARTSEGWAERDELSELTRERAFDPLRRAELPFARGLMTVTLLDDEILSLIKEGRSFFVSGDEIAGDLSPQKADAVARGVPLFGGGVPGNAKGTVRFRIEGGRITQYSVRAHSVHTMTGPPIPSPDAPRAATRTVTYEVDRVTLIDYAPAGTAPEIPAATLARLDAKPAARRP